MGSKMIEMNVGKEFYSRLSNRNELQNDGQYHAKDFRKKYLNFLDNPKIWEDDSNQIVLDFKDVTKITPSFANEAFAYFTKYKNATPNRIRKKIKFENISFVDEVIIDNELKSGYKC